MNSAILLGAFILLILIDVPIAFALLGGSIYYLLAGLGLIASGFLLFRGRTTGAWVYLGVFGLTLVWALWEVGLDGWALVPRVIGPAVLAILVLLVLPILLPERWRWPKALGAAAGAVLVLIAGAAVVVARRNAARSRDVAASVSSPRRKRTSPYTA